MNDITTEVDIDFDFCSLTYGESPCTAALNTTGPAKCFNTRATCQDPANYAPEVKTITFVPNQAFTAADKIPSLESVKIEPSRLSGGTGNEAPLGQRGRVVASFKDHPWDDAIVDKYADERADGTAGTPQYNPVETGTFWSKFRARNKFYTGRGFRIRNGIGNDIRERAYVQEKITGIAHSPTVIAKDPLKLADDERAQCPRANTGRLATGIDEVETSVSLTPVGIGDEEYPASGTASIGKELVTFTRSGDDLTLTRSINEVEQSHDAEDAFQLAQVYSGERPDDIVFDLLTNFSPVAASYIPFTDWQDEVNTFIPTLYSAVIAKPTSVKQLIGELAEQAGFGIAWDDLRQEIIFVAIKPPESTGFVINDDVIVADSFSVADANDKRISRLWTAFGLIDPVSNITENSNYRSVAILVDPTAEDAEEYDQPAIKKIFSRWIPQFGLGIAQALNTRLISSFRDIPRDMSFTLPRYLIDNIRLGGSYYLETRYIQDQFGRNKRIVIRILAIEEDKDVLRIEAEELLFTPSPETPNVRNLFISQNTLDFNLRVAHDQLYTPPESGDTVNCFISANAIVGATFPEDPAFDVGDWPSGVDVFIFNNGRIQGRGGTGGFGAEESSNYAAGNGAAGGTALYTRFAVEIENNGEIWGGGGGGSGGNGAFFGPDINESFHGGGGGGGGQGFLGGGGGSRGAGENLGNEGSDGSEGTPSAPGAGGPNGALLPSGGAGGGPGQAGESTGANGGAAGDAVDGDSFVTFTVEGDIQGARVN